MRKRNIPIGFRYIASEKLPCNKAKKDRVAPHEGQGTPVTFFIIHTPGVWKKLERITQIAPIPQSDKINVCNFF